MFAQVGLDGAVGGLMGPLILLWQLAAGFLIGLIGFWCIVWCIRAGNRRQELLEETTCSDQGKS